MGAMMTDEDKKAFAAILRGVADVYSREMSVDSIRLWWRLLSRFNVPEVKAAFEAHMMDSDAGRFMPMPAHIVGKIEKMNPQKNAPLSADEAWAIAVQAQDESATVVWNQPIATAWGIARDVMPDKVGARMAFKSAYERIMAEMPVGAEVKWFPSFGTEPSRRADVLEAAVKMGRLTAEHSAGLLPAPDSGQPTEAGKIALRQLMSTIKRIQ